MRKDIAHKMTIRQGEAALMLYREGNFIEATKDTPFLQIGKHTSGKPSLDTCEELVLLTICSMLRSNLSLGMPVDVTIMARDVCQVADRRRIGCDAAGLFVLKGWSSRGRRPRLRVEVEIAMPDLIRLYIRSVLIGFAISAVFAAVLIWQDVMGIGHLILASDIGWMAALMLVFFNGIIFAAVQFGIRIMMMAEDDEEPRGGMPLPLRPVPVTAAAKVDGRNAQAASRR